MEEELENNNKYMIFRLGKELYATSLLNVKEVIKPKGIKPVPYMVKHFKGVINLRGQIVSIVDLREKFNIDVKAENSLILIHDTESGALGAIIDDIERVAEIPEELVQNNFSVETNVPIDFFEGIAKLDDEIINIINISECLSTEELRLISHTVGIEAA